MNQNQMPLVEALKRFREEDPAYFRIPGHRFSRGIGEELQKGNLADYDLSEAEGLDDLHHPEGVIKKAQELAAELWGAKKTWFLVNGTTCGNEAMVLSAAREGEEIILPRNVHKSVLMGLIMSGAKPVYLMPEYEKKWGIWGGVTPQAVEEAFWRAPEAKAVLLVSPTYYGLCSDLEEIAAICHAHHAALLVDEAHGSHLYFSDRLPKGALQCGADACAQSIHKTAGSFTQSSLLHLASDRLGKAEITASLHMVQSTSPSYLLMASLDSARRELALFGAKRMERALELSEAARVSLRKIPGIRVLGREMEGSCGIFKIDPTRLVFSAKDLGISGYQLQTMLYEQNRVSTELADEENVVAVITWANTERDIERLIRAVEKAVEKKKGRWPEQMANPQSWHFDRNRELPRICMTPRKAYFARKEAVPFEKAAARIAGEMVVPYPPGIPILCPGEWISPEILEEIRAYRGQGCSFHGPGDESLETLLVVRE